MLMQNWIQTLTHEPWHVVCCVESVSRINIVNDPCIMLQLQNIVEFLQTFVYLFQDPENSMLRPVKYRLCQHMVLQPDCVFSHHPAAPRRTMSESAAGSPSNTCTSHMMCPTSDDLKYRFVRVSIDCIDLYLVESGTALNVQVGVYL